MFILGKDRKGGCYLEFQFCKKEKPLNDGKVACDEIEHWQDDSLLINDEDFDEFYKIYGYIFECAIFPNGEKGFDYCGINYYDLETAKQIIKKCIETMDDTNKKLMDWLKISTEHYNGFYILGL